ncbi:hypothetical protein KAU32_01690 [bacterium]|nr:hypothetical protein [bacterium]
MLLNKKDLLKFSKEEKIKRNLFMLVVVGLVLFLGCSDKTDFQTVPFDVKSQKSDISGLMLTNESQLNGGEIVWAHTKDGFEIIRIERLNSGKYAAISEGSQGRPTEFHELLHYKNEFFLMVLRNYINNGLVQFVDDTKKKIYVNELEKIIKSNISHTGLYNKIQHDLLKKAKKWTTNQYHYAIIETYLELTLKISEISEGEEIDIIYFAGLGDTINNVFAWAKYFFGPVLWDVGKCLTCCTICLSQAEAYASDFYDCGVFTYDKEKSDQYYKQCLESQCNCSGCPCDAGTPGP